MKIFWIWKRFSVPTSYQLIFISLMIQLSAIVESVDWERFERIKKIDVLNENIVRSEDERRGIVRLNITDPMKPEELITTDRAVLISNVVKYKQEWSEMERELSQVSPIPAITRLEIIDAGIFT